MSSDYSSRSSILLGRKPIAMFDESSPMDANEMKILRPKKEIESRKWNDQA